MKISGVQWYHVWLEEQLKTNGGVGGGGLTAGDDVIMRLPASSAKCTYSTECTRREEEGRWWIMVCSMEGFIYEAPRLPGFCDHLFAESLVGFVFFFFGFLSPLCNVNYCKSPILKLLFFSAKIQHSGKINFSFTDHRLRKGLLLHSLQ